MPKIPFESLNLKVQRRMARKKKLDNSEKPTEMNENTGLDTETYNGYVRLICDNTGDFLRANSFDDVASFLLQKKFRNKFNWFYNIKFDFESFVKYLDKDQLLTLYVDKSLKLVIDRIYKGEKKSKTEEILIHYLDKKFFSITDNNNHVCTFYDLFNFLDTSLNKASIKFLGETKNDDVDSSQLNTNWFYWEDNFTLIKKYCIQDAILTKKLADKFWFLIYSNMGFVPKKPFSKGKLSEEYFLKSGYIPTINYFSCLDSTYEKVSPKIKKFRKGILEYAYNSYYGGRFELIKRGFFDKVFTYDIKSAYPYQMTKLIDYSKGEWKNATDKHKPNPDANIGFYLVKITIKEVYYSPIVEKIGNLNLFPNGTFKKYLTKDELDFITINFPNADFIIESGFEFFPKNEIYPFKREIERLYEWKEKEKDADIKYVVKIILNSLYGKTIQVAGDNNIGNIFNPIYASLITSGTRIKLLELAQQKPESIIMFSTDGVHSESKLSIPKEAELGDFALDFAGKGVYIMSDIYNIWNTEKQKNKIRGFSVASEKDIDTKETVLKDILEKMKGSKYEYIVNRPYHLGECLIHVKKRTTEDINIWSENEKKSIDVNGDKKRIWEKDFKMGKNCLEEKILSLPMEV